MSVPVAHQVLPRACAYAFDSPGPVRVLDAAGAAIFSAPAGPVTLQLPAGGPYRVCAGEREIGPVWSGDLYVLAGQSNMEGQGDLPAGAREPAPGISNFAMDDVWMPARDPLHELVFSVDKCHAAKPLPRQDLAFPRCVGPGLSFAEEVRGTGTPVGLVPCAHGGTTISQWSPELKRLGGASLYGAMLRRIAAVGGGAAISGVLWYQGCSDYRGDLAPRYLERLKYFIYALRADTGRPDLPVYVVQISKFAPMEGANAANIQAWNLLQEAHIRVSQDLDHVYSTSAADLDMGDHVHIDTPSQRRLGRRLAQLALGRSRGIRVGEVSPFHRPDTIRVRFSGVTGRLHQAGEPGAPVRGFSIRTRDGADTCTVYRAWLDPESPDSVLLRYSGEVFERQLWYGHGLLPEGTLADDLDMPVPAFGPVDLPRRGALDRPPPPVADTVMCMAYRVSPRYGLVDQDQEPDFAVRHPPEDHTRPAACDWEVAYASRPTWPDGHGLLWISDREKDGKTGVYYLWTKLHSPARRRATLWFGFGGKARLWWNGQEVGGLPHGSKSMDRNQGYADVTLEAGDNILFVKATSYGLLGGRWIGTVRAHPLAREDVTNGV